MNSIFFLDREIIAEALEAVNELMALPGSPPECNRTAWETMPAKVRAGKAMPPLCGSLADPTAWEKP